MVPLSFLTPTPSKLERKKSTRFFFRPIRENILKLVFQSRILDALVCGWYPRRMENQVGPGDWKTQLRVGRYSIDLLWNLAPQDPPRNPSIIYYGQGISVYSGNYYTCVQRFGVPGRCTGFKTWPGQQSGRVRSIKPCFSIRNNRVICPAFYAIVACHAHHMQLPKLIVCHAPLSACSQFQTHLLHDTLYIKFLFLWLEQPSPPLSLFVP